MTAFSQLTCLLLFKWQATWGIFNHMGPKLLSQPLTPKLLHSPLNSEGPLYCSANNTTSGGNHWLLSWNNLSRAEDVTSPHFPSPRSCQMYMPAGSVWWWWCSDWKQCVSYRMGKKREDCLQFPDCSPMLKQWGTFWVFLTSAKIHRSVVQHWCCCVTHIMWRMQAFVQALDSIERPGWGMGARDRRELEIKNKSYRPGERIDITDWTWRKTTRRCWEVTAGIASSNDCFMHWCFCAGVSAAKHCLTGSKVTAKKIHIITLNQVESVKLNPYIVLKMLYWWDVTRADQSWTSRTLRTELDKQQWHIEKKQEARISLLMCCKW